MKKQGYIEKTMNIMHSSPEAGHLLAKLHDKHQMYALAEDSDPVARGELASIMAELMDLKLGISENELITDVLLSLMRQAESDLKRAVSERLAVQENVPLRLMLHFANDEILVADPVLRRSNVLNDHDLVYIIKAQKSEHWQAIASRPIMTEKLIDVLAETEDMPTAMTLVENKNIQLTEQAMTIFTEMSKKSDTLAKPLLMRHELPKGLAVKLYNYVGRQLKDYIRDNYKNITQDSVLETVEDIVAETAAAARGDFIPSMKMVMTAETMLERNLLKPEVMIDNLRQGKIPNFIAMFSVYCGLNVETIMEVLKQSTAQGLAVACKATGIQKHDFINIFLLTSRVRGGRIIDQKQLARALNYFDRVKEPIARKILNKNRH